MSTYRLKEVDRLVAKALKADYDAAVKQFATRIKTVANADEKKLHIRLKADVLHEAFADLWAVQARIRKFRSKYPLRKYGFFLVSDPTDLADQDVDLVRSLDASLPFQTWGFGEWHGGIR